MPACLLLALSAALAGAPWQPDVDTQGRLFARLGFIGDDWRDVWSLEGPVAHSHTGWVGPSLHVAASAEVPGAAAVSVRLAAAREDLSLLPHLEIGAGGLARVELQDGQEQRNLLLVSGPGEALNTWGWRVPLGRVPAEFSLRFELRGARLVDLALTSEDYRWAIIGPDGRAPVNRAVFSANHDPTDEQQMKVWHERMRLAWSRPFYEVSRDWKGPREVDWDAVRKRLEHHREVRTPLVLLHMGGLGHNEEGKPPADWEAFYADHRWLAEEFARRFPAREWDIKYVEMWNEPDDGFWFKAGWGGDPPHYSAFLQAASEGIKAGDPDMRVALGGIADPAGSSLRSFLWPCLEQFRVGDRADAVALHGYYGDPAKCTWDRTVLECRSICRRLAGRELPVLITEFNADFHEDFGRWLPFSKQSLYVAETLLHFLRRRVDAALYFCFGWLGSDFCPYYYDRDGKLIERPVVEAYAFYNDYAGQELQVQAPDELLPLAACEHEGAAWVFLEYDGHTPVRIELAPELAARVADEGQAFVFAGEKTQEPVPVKVADRAFTFPPAGARPPRGVVKVRLPGR